MRWAAFFLLVALLFPLQMSFDATKPAQPSSLLYTPDRRLMKVIACGHGPTLADLVWVQSTNYVMTEFKSGHTQIEHLYALYDVMTELDPSFVDAYVTGAIFLSAIADEPDLSLDLLEKGEGPLDEVGGEFVERKGPRGEPLGKVPPDHKERWKLLNETAATHLVSYASYAPTLEERYEELRTGGELYLFGAKRYPLERYPDRPPWYEQIGKTLTDRVAGRQKFVDISKSGWYGAAEQIWEQRLHFSEPGTPLHALYERRLLEVRSRKLFDELEQGKDRWEKGHGPARALSDFLVQVPKDPLGTGYFLVSSKLVAPALDAAIVERQLARDASRFRRAKGKNPSSVAEILAFSQEQGHPRTIPSWVRVQYVPETGQVSALGLPPS